MRSTMRSNAEAISINGLQLFAWLEAHCPSWRNGNLGARSWVASYARLSWTHIKHSKSPQLNPIARGQRLLHALENGFHGQLGLGLGNASLRDYFVDNVELDHARLRGAGSKWSFKLLMLRKITEIVNRSINPVN